MNEVMKGGGVNVNPPCSKLPVEDAMASDAEQPSSGGDEGRDGVTASVRRGDEGERAGGGREWLLGGWAAV